MQIGSATSDLQCKSGVALRIYTMNVTMIARRILIILAAANEVLQQPQHELRLSLGIGVAVIRVIRVGPRRVNRLNFRVPQQNQIKIWHFELLALILWVKNN